MATIESGSDVPENPSLQMPRLALLQEERTGTKDQVQQAFATSEGMPPADPFDPGERYVEILASSDRETQAPAILALCNALVEKKSWAAIHALLEEKHNSPPDVLYFHALVLRKLEENAKAQQKLEMAVRHSKKPKREYMLLLSELDSEKPGPRSGTPLSVFITRRRKSRSGKRSTPHKVRVLKRDPDPQA